MKEASFSSAHPPMPWIFAIPKHPNRFGCLSTAPAEREPWYVNLLSAVVLGPGVINIGHAGSLNGIGINRDVQAGQGLILDDRRHIDLGEQNLGSTGSVDMLEEVGVDEVHAELLPQDKVKKLEDILKEHKAIFVGDGINDAPVLARADLGVAMGGIGSDAAIEAADIVLMTDELSSVVEVVKVAKRTRRIVTQNIVFALGTKLLVMILGIFGMANMWLAIFADVGVSLLAVMNSIRVLGGNLSYMKNIFKK